MVFSGVLGVVFLDLSGADGDEHETGGPGLCAGVSLILLLSSTEKVFVTMTGIE